MTKSKKRAVLHQAAKSSHARFTKLKNSGKAAFNTGNASTNPDRKNTKGGFYRLKNIFEFFKKYFLP